MIAKNNHTLLFIIRYDKLLAKVVTGHCSAHFKSYRRRILIYLFLAPQPRTYQEPRQGSEYCTLRTLILALVFLLCYHAFL